MATTKVRDLMTEHVTTVGPQDSLSTVYDMMDTNRIRHLPVVDEDRRLVGILSNRDLIRATVEGGSDLTVTAQRQMLNYVRVDEVMNTSPATIEPSADVREAGEMLLEYKLGCLPVVEGEALVGIITESDFVRSVVESLT